jgi:NADH dehydrogenase (ubiquinone) flavoprotein 2
LFYPSHKIINVYLSSLIPKGNDESLPFDFTEESYKEINYLLSKFPSNQKRSASIPVLMLAQKQNNNYLTLSAMKKVAKLLEVPEIEIFEVASFYTMFNRQPVGKYHL